MFNVPKLVAAVFKAVVSRLLVGNRPLPMIFSPLTLLSGQRRSQETKWSCVRHLLAAAPAPEPLRVRRQIQPLHATPAGPSVRGHRASKPPANASTVRLRGLQADVVLQRLTSLPETVRDAHGMDIEPGVELVVEFERGRSVHGIFRPRAQAHDSPGEDSLAHPADAVYDAALFDGDSR
jgi:hypothetical protein